jgi:hypothetical protein
MNNKYTVQVRIKVNGSKKTVKGISSYSAESYDKKFKKAVLNAVYTAYSDNKAGFKGKRKLKYDSKFDYELTEKPRIAYLGKPVKYAKRGINKRLHNEILLQQEKKSEQSKRDKHKEKEMSKSISKKKQQEELYGKKRREREERAREEKMPRIKKSEYKLFLEFKAMRQKQKQKKINNKNKNVRYYK